MSDFLQQMAASSHERLQAARRNCSEEALLRKALATAPPPRLSASAARFDLIAELKLRSPAVGQLKSSNEDVGGRVTAYARAGAAAVSVLTEPSRFDGTMTHLEIATKSLAPLNVPAMRKDFLVDPYQVIEARVAGAGGVLVILRMLPREGIEALLDCARTLGLFVLLEAFDEADIEAMHDVIGSTSRYGAGQHTAAAPVLAGLNCRDLATLQIVPERLVELAPLLPANVPRVAESGVASPDDAARVAAAGYEYALVGSALMQGGDPHALAAAMLKAGRENARRDGAGAPIATSADAPLAPPIAGRGS
jgi:indole-3-glycerol phosphate synthase